MATWTFQNKNTASWTETAKIVYADLLLLESGDRILLESEDRIILEQSVTSYSPTWNSVTRYSPTWNFTNKS
jgi:hypothetical protein